MANIDIYADDPISYNFIHYRHGDGPFTNTERVMFMTAKKILDDNPSAIFIIEWDIPASFVTMHGISVDRIRIIPHKWDGCNSYYYNHQVFEEYRTGQLTPFVNGILIFTPKTESFYIPEHNHLFNRRTIICITNKMEGLAEEYEATVFLPNGDYTRYLAGHLRRLDQLEEI